MRDFALAVEATTSPYTQKYKREKAKRRAILRIEGRQTFSSAVNQQCFCATPVSLLQAQSNKERGYE
jgi:hypothetical protein